MGMKREAERDPLRRYDQLWAAEYRGERMKIVSAVNVLQAAEKLLPFDAERRVGDLPHAAVGELIKSERALAAAEHAVLEHVGHPKFFILEQVHIIPCLSFDFRRYYMCFPLRLQGNVRRIPKRCFLWKAASPYGGAAFCVFSCRRDDNGSSCARRRCPAERPAPCRTPSSPCP